VSFTSPSEHCALRPASGPDSDRPCDRPKPRRRRLPWGFLPSSRRQPAASTHARGSHPALRSVLGVSHAHDGFRHHRPCGFVSPRCHVQGSPFRGLSPARSTNRFPGPPCPRAVVRRVPRKLPSVRGALGFRALLSERMRWSSTTVRPPGLRSPPGLAPPPGVPPAHRAANPGFSAGPATSACDLHRDEPTAADPWRLAGARVGWRGRPFRDFTLPARSRFAA